MFQRVSDLAAWSSAATALPDAMRNGEEAVVLLRVRWHSTYLFTHWKDEGHLDVWHTTRPDRLLCDRLATEPGFLIQHGILLVQL